MLCSPCSDKSRADCVHSDTLQTEFTSHAACQLEDTKFRGMIRDIADRSWLLPIIFRGDRL